MPLFQRLTGSHPTDPKIPVHAFQSIAGEWARGRMTAAQAQAAVTQVSGVALDAPQTTQAQALVATVTSIPISGSQASQADGRAQRALRIQEIDQAMLLADVGVYDANALRTRLTT